jgi:hypothetical protein
VNRASRPLAFDMTYKSGPASFGTPLSSKAPSYLYLAISLSVVALMVIGEHSEPGSWLFHYVVELDQGRVMGIHAFATCLMVGALAAVMRAGMSGVHIHGDGVEVREVQSWLVPRVRRFRWPELERIVLDQRSRIALDLWDGSRTFLPVVQDRQGLSTALERVAAARAIPVRGGLGLDEIPEREDTDLRAA